MSNTASIHYVFTQRMEMRLRALGYTQQAINAMTTVQADEILAEFDTPDFTPQEACDQSVGLVEIDFDELTELDPGQAVATTPATIAQFFAILHRGGAHRFTQDLTAGATGDKTVTRWSSTDEPLKVPPATGKENLYYSVNPTTVRVTDKDRAKYVGKSDAYIERFVASKNSTVAALNCLYADVDGKDFTTPTQADIDAHFEALRNDPGKAKSTDAALRNEAVGSAKKAAYKTDPAKYLALAVAHVARITPAPSAIVATGGGFQCFWFFDSPFILRNDEDRKRAINLQKRWVTFVGGDPGVCDIRRVLRLPGSINHKKAYAPNFPLVSFTKTDFDLRYSLNSLEACLPVPVVTEATTTHTKAHSATTEATEAATLDIAQLQAKNDSLVSLFNASFKVRDLLRMYGFSDQGDRMSRPGEPDSKGVEIDEATNRSRHWSGNDPLHDPHWQTPFSIWCKMEFGNVFATARQTLINGIFPDFRQWARSTSFEDQIPDAFKALNQYGNLVYMTDATDTKVFDAMLDVYEKVGGFGASVSKRIGGRNAGVGANTFVRSLQRMVNFFDVTVNDDHTYYVRLKWENPVLSRWTTYALLKIVNAKLGGPSATNDNSTPIVNEYSPRKADEPFLIGTSKLMRERIQDIAQATDSTPEQAKEDYTFASFGEAGIRCIDASKRCGDMTAQELADETGKKLSSIRTALRKLVQHGIVEATRPNVTTAYTYSLLPDYWQRIDAIAPNLRTYTTASRRENKRLESAQQWAQKGMDEAKAAKDIEQEHRIERRFAKLAKLRIPHLARLHPDLAPKDIERLAYEVAAYKRSPEVAQQVRDQRTEATAEHRDAVRMIHELANHAINQFVADGLRKPTTRMVVDAVMQFGTFEEPMVQQVVNTPSLVVFPEIKRSWMNL